MTPSPTRSPFRSSERPWMWGCGVAVALTVLFNLAIFHRSECPEFYHRNLNPPVSGRTEVAHPITYVSANSTCRKRVSVVWFRPDTRQWEDTQLSATTDCGFTGTVAGTVEVVEDATDATMRVVEFVERRRDGRTYRRDLVVHVNPLGKAPPPAHPNIWTQVDRVDIERPIWLPRGPNARDL